MSRSTNKPGRSVTWEHLGEPVWTRLIEVLVTSHHAETDPSGVVTPIDGRGGDGGIDILVKTGDGRTVVYQLKYFPEGFDGKAWGKRREKVTSSLKTAGKTYPDLDEWVLVYPARPTPSGTVFISKLKPENVNTKVTVWHRSRLDWLCGQHPRQVDAVLREEEYFLDNLKALNAEQAVLSTTSDLDARLARLGRLTEEVSTDWAIDFSKTPHGTVQVLRAKNPTAHLTSPIRINFAVSSDDEDVAARWRRAVGFGAPGTVSVPGHLVHGFSVDGPAWLAIAGDLKSVELTTVPQPPPPGAPGIRIDLSRDDSSLGRFMGKPRSWGKGVEGSALTVGFADLVDLEFLLPEALVTGQGKGAMTVAVDLTDPSVRQARDAARFLLNLNAATSMMIEVNGHGPLGRVEDMKPLFDEDYVAELTSILETCDDLLKIGEDLGTEFVFPTEISDWERVHIRSLRLMLEGKWVAAPPGAARATFTYTGGSADESGPSLSAGDAVQVLVPFKEASLEVLGQDFAIGTHMLWHPSMRLDPMPDEDLVIGQEYTMQATDGTPFRRALDERRDGDESQVTPWALTGIPEADLPA